MARGAWGSRIFAFGGSMVFAFFAFGEGGGGHGSPGGVFEKGSIDMGPLVPLAPRSPEGNFVNVGLCKKADACMSTTCC